MVEVNLPEPVELIDADLDIVSGGIQSANGNAHEDGLFGHGENDHAQDNEDLHMHLGN